jgi:hypothetical protein
MAKTKSLTPAEKKLKLQGLKLALKQHNEEIKKVVADGKAADKALAVATKEAEAGVATMQKALSSAEKTCAAAVKVAEKAHAANLIKVKKFLDAAAKGTEKLTAQITDLEAPIAVALAPAPALAAKKAPPVKLKKVKVEEAEEALV